MKPDLEEKSFMRIKMKELNKKIIKITGMSFAGIGAIVGIIFLFSSLNFSCIAKPLLW